MIGIWKQNGIKMKYTVSSDFKHEPKVSSDFKHNPSAKNHLQSLNSLSDLESEYSKEPRILPRRLSSERTSSPNQLVQHDHQVEDRVPTSNDPARQHSHQLLPPSELETGLLWPYEKDNQLIQQNVDKFCLLNGDNYLNLISLDKLNSTGCFYLDTVRCKNHSF